jgi:SNF family Na+-dependent transporter
MADPAAPHRPREQWSSRLGVILAVAGSAIGLGNFLRFPGQAAQYGGGAFMIAYFVSLLLLGLPIGWAEWTMGRYAGAHGYNSSPGILHFIGRGRAWKYVGVIGALIPVVIYMYYVYIEAWCLGYAFNFLRGSMHFATAKEAGDYWGNFIGIGGNGSAVGFDLNHVGTYLLVVFLLNFVLIYRGIAKGIEWFCNFAMPLLIAIALVVLLRVLTLGTPDPAQPERSVINGLGFMWNPQKVLVERNTGGTWKTERELVGESTIAEARAAAAADPELRVVERTIWDQLKRPQLWLAAAGQIFFSLSVGFGVIITYSSYLRRRDDVVLSGLTATSANEFCEVSLGGLITLPAAVAFLGVMEVAGKGTFGLGFNVLPLVFAQMPAGQLFGFLFFFLLFLAAVTSSLSMLQPGIAFLEEALGIGRHRSVTILGVLTLIGCGFVVWFSKDVKALDTLDFWVGTFLIFVLATIQIILFGWVLGMDKGWKEAHAGAAISIPRIFKPIMKYVSPLFLLAIFVMWFLMNVLGYSFETGTSEVSSYVSDLFGESPNSVAWMSVGVITVVAVLFCIITARARAFKVPLTEESKL